jgi:hypothetical protein
MVDLVERGEFALIPDEIRAMKRLWENRGLDSIVKRREFEEALCESGLER